MFFLIRSLSLLLLFLLSVSYVSSSSTTTTTILPHEFFLQSLNVEVNTNNNQNSSLLVGNETLTIKAVVDVLVFGATSTSSTNSNNNNNNALSLFKSSGSSVFLSRRDASSRTNYKTPGGIVETVFGQLPSKSVSTSDYETWTTNNNNNGGGGSSSSGIEIRISSPSLIFANDGTTTTSTTQNNININFPFKHHPIKVDFLNSNPSQKILDTYYNAFERSQEVSSSTSTPSLCQQTNKYKCCPSTHHNNSSQQFVAYSLDYNFTDPILCSRETFSLQQQQSQNNNNKVSVSTSLDLNVEAIVNGNQQLLNKTVKMKVFDSTSTTTATTKEKLEEETFSSSANFSSSTSTATIRMSIQKQSLSSTATSILDSLRTGVFDASSPFLEKRFCFHRFPPATTTNNNNNNQLFLSSASLKAFVAPNSTTFGSNRNRLGYFSDIFAQQDKQCDQPGVFYTAIYAPPSNKVDPLDQLAAIYDRYLIANSMTSLTSTSSNTNNNNDCEMISANFSEDSSQNNNLVLHSAEFACKERRNFQLEVDAEVKVDGGLKRLFPLNIIADSFSEVVEQESSRKLISTNNNNNNNNRFSFTTSLNVSFCIDINNRGFGVATPSGSLLFQIKSFSCDGTKKNNNTLFSYNYSCSSSLNTNSVFVEPSHRPQIDQFSTQRFCIRGAKMDLVTTDVVFHSNTFNNTLLDLLLSKKKSDDLLNDNDNLLLSSFFSTHFEGEVVVEVQDLAAKVLTEVPIRWRSLSSSSFVSSLIVVESFNNNNSSSSFLNNTHFIRTYLGNCSLQQQHPQKNTSLPTEVHCTREIDMENKFALCQELFNNLSYYNSTLKDCSFSDENVPEKSDDDQVMNNCTTTTNYSTPTINNTYTHHQCLLLEDTLNNNNNISTIASKACWFESSDASTQKLSPKLDLCPDANTNPASPTYKNTSNNIIIDFLASHLSSLENEIRSSTFNFNLTILRQLNNQLQSNILERQQEEIAETKRKHAATAFFLTIDCILIVLVIFYFVLKKSPKLQKHLDLEEYFDKIERFQEEKRQQRRAVSMSTTSSCAIDDDEFENNNREKSPHSPFHRFPDENSSSPSPKHNFHNNNPPHHQLHISPSPVPNSSHQEQQTSFFWIFLQESWTNFTTWCSETWVIVSKWFAEITSKCSKKWCGEDKEMEEEQQQEEMKKNKRSASSNKKHQTGRRMSQKPSAISEAEQQQQNNNNYSKKKKSRSRHHHQQQEVTAFAVVENQPRENLFLQSFQKNNHNNYNFETASLPPATELDFGVSPSHQKRNRSVSSSSRRANSHNNNNNIVVASPFRATESFPPQNNDNNTNKESFSKSKNLSNKRRGASSSSVSSSAVTGWSAADLTSEVIPHHHHRQKTSSSMARSDLSIFLPTYNNNNNNINSRARSSQSQAAAASASAFVNNIDLLDDSTKTSSVVVPNFQLSSTRKARHHLQQSEQQPQQKQEQIPVQQKSTSTKKKHHRRTSSSARSASDSSSSSSRHRRNQQQQFFCNNNATGGGQYYDDGDYNNNTNSSFSGSGDDLSVG